MIIALLVCLVAGAFMMHEMGKKALNMSPEAIKRNHLMKERTLSCAEPIDVEKCRKATTALNAFDNATRERLGLDSH